jgi:hypothetical protein
MLIAHTVTGQNVEAGCRTLHADRAPAACDRRPSHFKTFKYRPDFPDRVGCIEDTRAHCQRFFAWYDTEHRHSGIALMTRHTVHYGGAPELTRTRCATLDGRLLGPP